MRWVHALFVGLPIAIACRLLHAPDWCVFVGAVTSLIPLAHWIGEGSEQLAARTGPSLGGLLTATFANAAELIITILALSRGLVDLVKASITGSIIANTLPSAGLSASFIGLILIPLVGNAAEQFAAIRFAAANRIDLSFSIAANSSTQIALFVAPVLVLVSLFFSPMDLVLPSIQLVTLLASSAIFAYLSLDGETNWFEGVQLLALYLIAATAFFFLS